MGDPTTDTPPPDAPTYQATSCLCRAQEGALHSPWCDLRPFPGCLEMDQETVHVLNARYREDYGKLVDGELDIRKRGDYRVFGCACGCGARVAMSGMLYALTPGSDWYIKGHQPMGMVRMGARYREKPEG